MYDTILMDLYLKDLPDIEKYDEDLRINISKTYGFALFQASYKLKELKEEILKSLHLN